MLAVPCLAEPPGAPLAPEIPADIQVSLDHPEATLEIWNLMVSLGSTGVVNQIVSGLVAIYSRALQPGDYVRVGSDEGVVRGVGMLSIKLGTARREEITIPNALLLLAASRTEGVRPTPEPRVAQRTLSDFYVEYVLMVNVERGQFRQVVLAQLHSRILDVFNEHGVQIMSPHFVAQPDRSVAVPESRGYESPARRPAAEG